MSNLDRLEKKVNDLENLASEVETMGIQLLQESPAYDSSETDRTEWGILPDHLKLIQRDAHRKYQKWYNSAHQLIKEYIPEKEQEFVTHYEDERTSMGVVDMLQLRSAWWIGIYHPREKRFVDAFEIQRSILLSVPDVAEIKEFNLRRLISADVAKTEIEQAEVLLASGFERAAGSIAGIALELHLKTLCDVNGVSYKPKDTIDPLATALYKAGILDITEYKRIQFLASIRNKCSHPNPVLSTEIKNLIEEVKKLI